MRRMRNPNELFVGDLSFFCREHHLVELFSSCGGVVDARIKRSEAKGKTLMYGFVRMDSLKGALTAAKELNGYIFMGRTMKVQLSLTNTYHDHTQVALQGYQVHSSFTSFFPNDAIIEPDEGKLRRLYEPFGEIYDVVVKEYIVHHKDQRQEGYGFVTFATEEQAHYAASQCTCVIIDGIRIESTISHRSRTHDPAIPGYPLNNSSPQQQQPQQLQQPPPQRGGPIYDSNSHFNNLLDNTYRAPLTTMKSEPLSYPTPPANTMPTYLPHQQQHPQNHQPQQQMSLISSSSGIPMNGANQTPSLQYSNQYQQQQHSPQLHQSPSLNKPPSAIMTPITQQSHFHIPPPPSIHPPASVLGANGHMQPHTAPSNIGSTLSSVPPQQSPPLFYPTTVPLNMYPMQPPTFPGMMPQPTQTHSHSSSSDVSLENSGRLYMAPLPPPQQQFSHHDSSLRNLTDGMTSNSFLSGDRWSQQPYPQSYNFQSNQLGGFNPLL